MAPHALVIFLLFSILIGGSLSTGDWTTLKEKQIPREIPTMTVPELIRYWGYDCEEHYLTTEDGYILGIHRIPRGKKHKTSETQDSERIPVILAHGLLSSSSQWVFGPPNNSLGFMLADQGYDVWMMNTRGNTYSRNHVTFDTCSSCPEFWSFCWHEGGTKDYSALIDFVLDETGHEELFYVGHSMGTTQYAVLLSEKPEYNSKIRAGFLLAPAVFMTNAYNPIFLLTDYIETIQDLLEMFGIYEFLPHPDVISWLGHQVCNEEDHPIYSNVCGNIAFLLFGIHPDQLNITMLPVYLDHVPAGSSMRPFLHYAQLHVNGGKFSKFDFGSAEENFKHYGQDEPPEYSLSNVVAPSAIFVGEKDDLATPPDGVQLAGALPNVFHFELLDYNDCGHFDFAIGIDARGKIYDSILKMMQEM